MLRPMSTTGSPPSPLRCLVADDDPLVCETVAAFLRRIGGVESCLQAGDGVTALNLLSTGGLDALFLDVQMPGLDGPSLLRALPPELPVVVISASTDFAAASYEFDVVDYLLKPLDFARFARAWQRLLRRRRPSPLSAPPESASIFVKDGTDIQRVDLDDLLFVKAEANYIDLVGADRSVLTLMSLKRIEELLPPHFVRVHRSYIVNSRRVDRFEDGILHLGRHRVPVGDSHRDDLLRAIRVLN